MSNVIIAAPPVPGETIPMLEIASYLVDHGHTVTVVAGSDFADQAIATGAEFAPLRGDADMTGARFAARMAEHGPIAPGPDQLNFDWVAFFIDPIPEEHAILQELLENRPDSVLVANSLFLGALPTALGAPGRRPARWVAIGANPVSLPSVDTTPLGPIPGLTGEAAQTAHREANSGFAQMFEPSRARAMEHTAALGATEPVPPVTDFLYNAADTFAALSVPEFDFPHSDAGASIRYVGIIPSRTSPDWVQPSWWGELEDGKPVIVVTQGTTANADLTELVRPTMDAFSEEDVHVVVLLGRSVEGSGLDVPANAHLAEFIPMSELLPKADLLITNGGYGGTQLALAAAVPVIVAGTTEDKPMTAARVAFHEVGIDLGTSTPTRDQVHAAFTQITASQDGAENLRRLAAGYRAHDALREIESIITQ